MNAPHQTDFNDFILILSWMDKLGVSAREGLGVVMRQTYYGLYYPLTDKNNLPNPVSASKYIQNLIGYSHEIPIIKILHLNISGLLAIVST